MACYHPLRAFQKDKCRPVFKVPAGGGYRQLILPCGRCIGCRLERSRQWAVRCTHEASLHDENSFVTLTYNDVHLKSMSLDYRDFQLFMKRLRKNFGKVTFYMAGEYGEKNSRPHFHACLFGVGFADKRYLRTTAKGSKLYSSVLLDSLWGKGYSSIGTVNFESAGYLARYIVAKNLGDGDNFDHIVNPDTGEVFSRRKEFSRMSLRCGEKGEPGGIGARWLKRFGSDVYPHGNVVSNGVERLAPRYYDSIFKLEDAVEFEALKARRQFAADLHWDDNSPKRLGVKEVVRRAQNSFLSRSIPDVVINSNS